MPKPNQRTGSFRKVFVKTPGGTTKLHYKKRNPSKAICGECGKNLAGVPSERPSKMRTMAKSAKRPERPYGGNLCSSCTRKVLTQKARA
jgi:large subunit ribosomal protein L34e